MSSGPPRPNPPPMKTNDVQIAWICTAGWAVALIVLLVMGRHLPADHQWWRWTCVAGIGFGLFGVWYIPRLQNSREQTEERRAVARQDDQLLDSQPDAPPAVSRPRETAESQPDRPRD